MLAVIAIKVAARMDVRIGAGTSSDNANDAFEFSMMASVLGVGTMHTHNAPRYRVDHLVEDGNYLTENAETATALDLKK
jgi:hypothetical protein